MMNKNYDFSYTQDRELSWLKFNERVLREADKKNVPIFERLKFLEILIFPRILILINMRISLQNMLSDLQS